MKRPPPGFGAQVLPFPVSNHEDAARIAMQWLSERHRKGWRSAFEALLDDLRPEVDADDWSLDEDATQMLTVNAGEWLLARGQMLVKGETRSINEHLLGRDGPYLTPGQQQWIAQLRARPLRLYRVTDVRVGEGLTLVDALDASAAPVAVQERSGSRSAKPGMLMGARVMHLQDGHHELSGAIYPFARLRETVVLAQVQAALEAGLLPQNNQDLAELEIARAWLAQWFEPLPMPEMRDAATGEPMLLVTDHYRVLDAKALSDALQAHPEVSGSAAQGWHLDSDAGDGLLRSLAAINPGKAADRIEVFYRTQRLADEGRAWFEALAATAVQHLTREVTDPRSAAALSGGPSKASPAPLIEPEAMTALMAQVLRRHYANWADEPIPLLANQTPRQAITTAAGLERVKGLLREYEAGEADMAKRDGRREVSYQFLWDELGIARAS
jgi:hypothetical protein